MRSPIPLNLITYDDALAVILHTFGYLLLTFFLFSFLCPHLYVAEHNPTFIIKHNRNINMLFLTSMHMNLIFKSKVLVKRNTLFQ